MLDTIAGVFTDGARRAKAIVGEITHELADDPRRGSTSVKVADTHGADLKVTRTQPTKVVVDEAEVIDVLIAHQVKRYGEDGAAHFALGARAAVRAYREIAAAHTFKTTSLEEWVRDLDAAEEHALAIRLGHAFGRVSHGNATTKIERVSRKPAAAGSDETAQS